MERNPPQRFGGMPRNVAGMVTRPRKTITRRLYLAEHREAKGVSVPEMAKRLGIERESVYRLERNAYRVAWHKAVKYADALGIAPAALLWPPGAISIEELPDDLRTMTAEIVSLAIARR